MEKPAAKIIVATADGEVLNTIEVGDRLPAGYDIESPEDPEFAYYARESGFWDSQEIGQSIVRTIIYHIHRQEIKGG